MHLHLCNFDPSVHVSVPPCCHRIAPHHSGMSSLPLPPSLTGLPLAPQKIGIFAEILASIHGAPDASRFMVPYSSAYELGVSLQSLLPASAAQQRLERENAAFLAAENAAKYQCLRFIKGLLERKGFFNEEQWYVPFMLCCRALG